MLDCSYHLKAPGELKEDLKGDFNFEKAIKVADGHVFSTLTLKLENEALHHSVEFIISKKDLESESLVGTYEVSEKIGGFLNPFDGVFGYADINDLGELPFFADSGRIRIREISEGTLSGTMSVTLKNAKGNSIVLEGAFASEEH